MGLYRCHKTDDVWWGIWKIEESLHCLATLLPDPEIYTADLQVLRNENKQIERLAVRVLLYTLLGEEKKVLYHSTGRPYLADSVWNISISHTAGYVAAIGSKSSMVGIDIERYGDRIKKVSSKFMREDEFVSLYQEDDIWSLLLHWSAKEVMFKCIDCEGTDFCKHLRVFPFRVQNKGSLQAREYRTKSEHEFLIYYEVEKEFVLVWSVGNK